MFFDFDTVRWVLNNYIELSHGLWPDPEVDENITHRKQLSCHAPFENPCLIAGEVSARVRLCGMDGMLVEECCGMIAGCPLKPSEIARRRHMDFNEVCNRLNKVIWYCTDEDGGRRQESYQDWKRHTHGNRKYRVERR